MPRHHPLPFVFAVGTLGIALFSIMDAVMKGMTLAMGVYNAMLWRMVAGVVLSGAIWLARRSPRPSPEAMRLHVIRGLVSTAMALLFFWGLARVPMAQAIALAYVAPLLALYLSAVLLGEQVPRSAIGASLVAMAGVGLIFVAQAREDMGEEALIGAIAILASAICYSWNIILMRQQSLVAGPTEVAFFQTLVVVVVLLLAAPWLAVVPGPDQTVPIVMAASLATVSLFLLSWAYGRGEANYLAPTEYTSFVWAAMLGWAVFGERVSFYTLAGAALIVAGCILAARRGRPVAPEAEAALP